MINYMKIKKTFLSIYKFIVLILIIISCEGSNDVVLNVGSSGINSNFSTKGESGTGIGGSMARFTIVGDYLYTVDSWDLNTFDISDQEPAARAAAAASSPLDRRPHAGALSAVCCG